MKNKTKPRGIKMKHDPETSNFGFDLWNLDTQQKFQNLINDMIAEGMEIATKEYDAFAYIEPSEPDTLRVGLPVGSDSSDNAYWTVSLARIVRNVAQLTGSHAELTAFKNHLKSLVVCVEKQLKE
jgi:hypothetical protein